MTDLRYLWSKGKAVVLLLAGRREAALAVFDDMVGRWPEAAYPRASRAHLLAQAGRHAQALADYDTLLRASPDDARAWFNKGFVLELLQRWDEALVAFRRAT